jgi:hypothetical protein
MLVAFWTYPSTSQYDHSDQALLADWISVSICSMLVSSSTSLELVAANSSCSTANR